MFMSTGPDTVKPHSSIICCSVDKITTTHLSPFSVCYSPTLTCATTQYMAAVPKHTYRCVSTLDMQSSGCTVCGSERPPGPSGGPVGPGPGRLYLGRAAPDQPLPAAGGGSRPGPGAGPCSGGRILHRTCRVQLLCGAADTNINTLRY